MNNPLGSCPSFQVIYLLIDDTTGPGLPISKSKNTENHETDLPVATNLREICGADLMYPLG